MALKRVLGRPSVTAPLARVPTLEIAAGCLPEAAPKPKRSKKATRPQLLTRDQLDGRTNAAKFFDKIVVDIENDLGGHDQLSTITRALIEGFAGAALTLCNLNAQLGPRRVDRRDRTRASRQRDGSGRQPSWYPTAGAGTSPTLSFNDYLARAHSETAGKSFPAADEWLPKRPKRRTRTRGGHRKGRDAARIR